MLAHIKYACIFIFIISWRNQHWWMFSLWMYRTRHTPDGFTVARQQEHIFCRLPREAACLFQFSHRRHVSYVLGELSTL